MLSFFLKSLAPFSAKRHITDLYNVLLARSTNVYCLALTIWCRICNSCTKESSSHCTHPNPRYHPQHAHRRDSIRTQWHTAHRLRQRVTPPSLWGEERTPLKSAQISRPTPPPGPLPEASERGSALKVDGFYAHSWTYLRVYSQCHHRVTLPQCIGMLPP